MKRIFVFIFSLLILSTIAYGKDRNKKREILPDTIPMLNNISVGIDLIRPLSIVFNDYYSGVEASVDVDLKHRFFPTIELGGGKYDRTKNGMDHKMNGGFGRIGLNYNIFNNSQALNYGYIGIRYGYGFENYSYKNGQTFGSYWEDKMPVNLTQLKSHTHWGEAVVGIRVQIYKAISMGWSFRYNFRLIQNNSKYAPPYYVPGFGKNNRTNAAFTYSIYYRFKL